MPWHLLRRWALIPCNQLCAEAPPRIDCVSSIYASLSPSCYSCRLHGRATQAVASRHAARCRPRRGTRRVPQLTESTSSGKRRGTSRCCLGERLFLQIVVRAISLWCVMALCMRFACITEVTTSTFLFSFGKAPKTCIFVLEEEGLRRETFFTVCGADYLVVAECKFILYNGGVGGNSACSLYFVGRRVPPNGILLCRVDILSTPSWLAPIVNRRGVIADATQLVRKYEFSLMPFIVRKNVSFIVRLNVPYTGFYRRK